MKNQYTIAITATLTTALLAGLFTMGATSPQAYAEEDYGDDSETEKEINDKQKGTASGESNNNFCANNLIEAGNSIPQCDVGATVFTNPIPTQVN